MGRDTRLMAPSSVPAPGFHLVVYSDAATRGGAEMNLSRVLEALPPRVRVTLVGVDDELGRWLAAHRPGTDTMVLPPVKDKTDLRGLARHRAMFVRLRPDILQFNLSTASSCQWAIAAATTIRGLRRVVVENSPMGVWSSTSGALKRSTSPRLAAHIAVGDRMARMIEESSGLRAGSIATLYHGVPAPGRDPVDRPEAPTLLTVARHDPVKGIDVLLDAMASVPPPTQLVVIGDGPEWDRLLEQRARLHLEDRVEFRSLSWDVRVADLMWAFDALVLPSRLEGFPVTIVEAMLAGLPVIATDVGSVDEAVVPGSTGWIVAPEDPTALATAISELVADLPAGRSMGARARVIAEDRFTIDATVDAYLSLYDGILRPAPTT